MPSAGWRAQYTIAPSVCERRWPLPGGTRRRCAALKTPREDCSSRALAHALRVPPAACPLRVMGPVRTPSAVMTLIHVRCTRYPRHHTAAPEPFFLCGTCKMRVGVCDREDDRREVTVCWTGRPRLWSVAQTGVIGTTERRSHGGWGGVCAIPVSTPGRQWRAGSSQTPDGRSGPRPSAPRPVPPPRHRAPRTPGPGATGRRWRGS